MKGDIVIVPNSELAKKGDELRVVMSDKSFYSQFSDYNLSIVICAIVNGTNKEFGWNINENDDISYVRQNVFSSRNILGKIINYVFGVFQALRVVHQHRNFYLFMPGNVSLIYGLILLFFRKEYGIYMRGDYTQSYLHPVYRFVVGKAKFVIVTGNFLGHNVRKINKRTLLVVPMVITSYEDLWSERNLPIDRPIRFLFVGRPSREKGIFELLQSCIKLKESGLEFELNIIGDNGKESKLELLRFIKVNNLINHVNLQGSVNQPERLKSMFMYSDVFVLPSYHEGFPRVVYEAMTFGLPMILTDIQSYKFTFEHNVHCELVDVKDSACLYLSMKELSCDAVKYKMYSRRGLNMMKNNYRYFVREKNHARQVISELNL